MSDSDPPSEYTRIRDFIARIEKNILPARQYLQESYENWPLTTTVMVVSAALSFAPIVVVLALTVFTVFLTMAACLVALVGIVLASLATALISFALVTTLTVAFHLLPAGGLSWTGTMERREEPSDGVPTPRKEPSLITLHLLALTLLCEAISRLHLPRAVRHHPIYRTIFGYKLFRGRGQSEHPLQWILSLPFFLLRTVLWFALTFPLSIVGPQRARRVHWVLSLPFALLHTTLRLVSAAAMLPFTLLGWKLPLAIALTALVLSPRVRGAAHRAAGRLSSRVSTAAATEFARAWHAALQDRTRTAAAAATAHAKDAARAGLVVLVEYLRAELEKLEARPGAPAPAEAATSEMAAPPAVEASGSAADFPLQAAGTLRPRTVSAQVEES